MRVNGIGLLSYKEYVKYRAIVPLVTEWWFLRSPGCDSSYRKYVVTIDTYGRIHDSYHDAFEPVGIRPVLRVFGLESKPGDKVGIFGYSWTVLDTNLVLCDSVIANRYFDEKSNNWETSEMKAWLEKWLANMTAEENAENTSRKNIIKIDIKALEQQVYLCDTHSVNASSKEECDMFDAIANLLSEIKWSLEHDEEIVIN